jgi:hypothetical protein
MTFGSRRPRTDIRATELTARKRPFVTFGKLMTYPPRVKSVADCEEREISQLPGDNTKAELRSDAKTPENTPPMLDVHAPREALHTWKGFFLHIATIVVGLFIAVALEQSVEAIIRHHEAASLREDLGQESRQILADARSSEAAHVYETRWLMTRIAQTQLAIREHHPIAPREANEMPRYSTPDNPIWRSAKAGGRTVLLTKGEVNAYAEIEYVQAHLDTWDVAKDAARHAVNSFNLRFPALPNGDPDLSDASLEDLRTYLGMLTTACEQINVYVRWLRIINGAESAVIDGKTSLQEIYASERKTSGGEIVKNFM